MSVSSWIHRGPVSVNEFMIYKNISLNNDKRVVLLKYINKGQHDGLSYTKGFNVTSSVLKYINLIICRPFKKEYGLGI